MFAGSNPAEKKKEKRDFEIGTKLMRRFRREEGNGSDY